MHSVRRVSNSQAGIAIFHPARPFPTPELQVGQVVVERLGDERVSSSEFEEPTFSLEVSYTMIFTAVHRISFQQRLHCRCVHPQTGFGSELLQGTDCIVT